MAFPKHEATYFPPLDQCFSGAASLIPWTTAHGALQDFSSARTNEMVESFFRDKQTQAVLISQLKPFPRPSPQTKSEFDNRTAPIHVSQSANGDYDLQQLKDDALWLSKEVDIDEVSALRCAIAEWQQRPADSILGKIKSDDGGQLMKQSLFGRSTMRFGASTNGAAAVGPDFGNVEFRRERLLTVVLDETSAARACTAILVPLPAQNVKDGALEARSPASSSAATASLWIDEVATQVYDEIAKEKGRLSTHIQQLRDFGRQLEGAPQWLDVFKERPSLATTYLDHVLQDMVSVLRSLLAMIFVMDAIPGKTDVQQWFAFAEDNLFFNNIGSISPVQELYVPLLQILVSIIGAAILKPVQAIEDIKQRYLTWQEQTVTGDPTTMQDEAMPYTMDKGCINKVNAIIHTAAQQENRIAALAIYAWASVSMVFRDLVKYQNHQLQDGDESDDEAGMRTRSSRGTPGSTWIESLWEIVQGPTPLESHHEDNAQYLAATALDSMQMYSMIANLSNNASSTFAASSDTAFAVIVRLSIFNLVESSLPVVQYGPEVMESILALCDPETPLKSSAKSTLRFVEQAAASNEQLRSLVINQALSRFQYELSPALLLLASLACVQPDPRGVLPDVVEILDNLDTFMITTPEHFDKYALENEDQGRDEIYLTEDYPIFTSRRNLGYWQQQQSQENSRALVLADGSSSNLVATIPSQTPGFILSDRRPWVMRLSHRHSGLEYLGVLLSTLLPHSEIVATDGAGYIDKQVASHIIGLITSLLSAATGQDSKNSRSYILGRFGGALREGIDMVSIIAEITESELMAQSDRSANEDSPDLLVACIKFFDELMAHSPERTWSWLSRSSLLGVNGSGVSALAAVVTGVEVPVRKYPFLSACVQLYHTLLRDAVQGILSRKPKVETSAVGRRRFDSPIETPEQTPERTVAKVLADFTNLARGVLVGLGDWHFEILEEKVSIVTTLCETFELLLTASYGVGSDKKDGERLNEVLIPAATTQTLSQFILAPLDTVLVQGSAVNDETLSAGQQNMIASQTEAVLAYLLAVLRTLKFRSGTAGSLPAQIVKTMPTLTTLYASSARFKAPIAELLDELLTPGPNDSEELSPLLAELTPENAKNFLALLSQLDRPINDLATECHIWSLLASILNGSQQFFAMYLLTGALPKDRYKVEGDSKKHRTLLGYALEQLADIQNLTYKRAIAMLQFVAKAQQVWIWATNEIAKSDFVKSALSWLETLKAAGPSPTHTEVNLLTGELGMASLVCDVLAVNLHTSLEVGDKTLLKLVSPKLSFLSEHAAKVDAYNLSLHKNFALNLPKSVSCEPADFARTAANPAPLGEHHVYDVKLAEAILGGQRSWSGFREEFLRSNSNLSLVQAQTNLLKSWETLATTLADAVETEQALQPALATAAMRAMQENIEANLETPYAAQLLQTRADMAFVLLSRLSSAKSQNTQMRDLLPLAWSLVRTSPVNYTTSTTAEDLSYYTTLLQLLYLALLPHTAPPSTSNSDNQSSTHYPLAIGPTLLDILTHTIAPSFRALCTNLHTSPELVQSTDFTLLTALVRALLSAHNLTPLHPRIAAAIADTNLSRSALALYTWSTTLSSDNPVYAPLALNFLTTLSAVPAIAQHLAVESILAQLSSAPLSDAFRKPPGRGPFDEPFECFEVWSRGFLPLCIDLLSAVGPPIAAEVAAFLNSFPAQLRRAETALVNAKPTARNPRAGAITLGLVSEATNLLLISAAVQSARELGAAEGLAAGVVPMLELDVEALKTEVGALARSERSLRDRVVAVTERELAVGVEGLAEEIVRMIKGFVEE